ncbi:MAG: transposase [Bdellovibrionales bacterium]|nr:transposase [Bdellovibrionales bacterium]
MERRTTWETSKKQFTTRTRRRPEETVLYRLVYEYRDELEWSWEDRFQSDYGVLRDEVLAAFDAYLNCGILLHGCARAECEKCDHSELIAFSCKRRNLCPSCDVKRALIFGEHLHKRVLFPHEHSHQVYTIPKRLRPYFKFNRKLLGKLYTAAKLAWGDLIEDAFPSDWKTGSVMALHTAGDLLNFHPHIHSLGLHGALDSDGNFHLLDSVDTEYLTRQFSHHVFEALLEAQLLEQETVTAMKCWDHSGFHVFVGDPVAADDEDARRFLARYLKKSPVMNPRLELTQSEVEPVVRVHKFTDDGSQTRDFEPLEFLAELSQHIPNMWEQTTRYVGVYSARTRGAKRLQLDFPGPLPEIDDPERPSTYWATCMKRVFEIDPLECPKCGATMKIKAFLQDQSEIKRLCENLSEVPWRAPPPLKLSLKHAA